MLKAIIKSRRLRAFGSVVDVAPMSDYSALLPVGSASERIGRYWEAADSFIGNSIERNADEPKGRRDRSDLTTA